jgi:MOSC domain-containing protein YiiM
MPREGVFAKVLAEGAIRRGDEIQIVDELSTSGEEPPPPKAGIED